MINCHHESDTILNTKFAFCIFMFSSYKVQNLIFVKMTNNFGQKRWKYAMVTVFPAWHGVSPPRVVPNVLTNTDPASCAVSVASLPCPSALRAAHTARASIALRRPGLCKNKTLPQANVASYRSFYFHFFGFYHYNFFQQICFHQ